MKTIFDVSHEHHSCTTCNQWTMRLKGANPRRCYLTARCTGVVRRSPQCSRRGCTNPARTVVLPSGEAVCTSCVFELLEVVA